MKNYKAGIIIFLILAIAISLFPPFEWNSYQETINETKYGWEGLPPPTETTVKKVIPYKSYEFLFCLNNGKGYSRTIIYSELILEYLLAVFVSTLTQVILSKSKKEV